MRSFACFVAACILLTLTGSAAAQGKSNSPGANGIPFQSLQGQIDDFQQQLTEAINTLQAQLDALNERVATNTASIEQLRERDVAHDRLMNALGAAVFVLRSRIASIETDIEALRVHNRFQNLWIAHLQQRLDATLARLAVDERAIDALFEAHNDQQELLGALQSYGNFLRFLITTNTTDINFLLDENSRVWQNIEDLQAQIREKQPLIFQSCAPGSSIRQVFPSGQIACEPDDVGFAVGNLVQGEVGGGMGVGPGALNSGFLGCAPGWRPTGGGYSNAIPGVTVITNVPFGNGWFWTLLNTNASAVTVGTVVKCSRVVP